MLIGCRKFSVEEEILKDRVIDVVREWSIKGLLEVEDNQVQVQRALFKYLNETGLISRIYTVYLYLLLLF